MLRTRTWLFAQHKLYRIVREALAKFHAIEYGPIGEPSGITNLNQVTTLRPTSGE